MRYVILMLFLFSFDINSIEISLEENKAESGTVGYVDIKKIFDRFSLKEKSDFNEEVKKKQAEIDELKKEVFALRAKREKLMWEYEVAKMYEEFKSRISQQLESSKINEGIEKSTDTVSSDVFENFSDSKSTSSLNPQAVISTSSVSLDVKSNEGNIDRSSSTVEQTESEPYITMPGVGKIPISVFKFSVSSSTAVIDSEMKYTEKKIEEMEKKIYEMKERYDAELSKKAEKNHIDIFKRIYEAIDEVARKEGISIVIDKRNILFGRKSIDLTDKVIERIEKE